ncbi:MAG TPA: hypothetical protein PLR78_10485 [Polaromonas sp.]|jgi:hypothetical protein|uniref:hypothetical protein n=1 Tax=Polaromonas sp. TaxID=1869339 RepID=UPI002C85CE02|nr:hypothetical protein [Polaromonas sp.]HQS32187.1 hypothetical protein [Polaromonas sp.]
MPHSSHFDQLRDAVHQERSEEALRRDRCDTFLKKVSLYQRGHGPLPDEQEFLLWREDMKRTVAIRALKAAVTLPAESQPVDSAPRSRPHRADDRSRGNGQSDHSPL